MMKRFIRSKLTLLQLPNAKTGQASGLSEMDRLRTTKLWSAVIYHRFPRFGDQSPKQGRDQRPGVEPSRPTCVRRRQVACAKRGQVHALQNVCGFAALG